MAVSGLVLLTTACGASGQLEITNSSPHAVTVQLGDDDTEVSSSGGAIVHEYGCSPGDVVVVSASGHRSVLPGPVCSGDHITVDSDGRVTVAAAEGAG